MATQVRKYQTKTPSLIVVTSKVSVVIVLVDTSRLVRIHHLPNKSCVSGIFVSENKIRGCLDICDL